MSDDAETVRAMRDYLADLYKFHAVDDTTMKFAGSYLPLEECLRRWGVRPCEPKPISALEKMARAMCAVQIPSVDPDAWVESGEPMRGPKNTRIQMMNPHYRFRAWHLFVNDAHAGLEAIREPTETMLRPLHNEEDQAFLKREALSPQWAWRAMIDAALNEKIA